MEPNGRKGQILGYLLRARQTTSREVADALGIGLDNASHLLSRYHGYGLLHRERQRGPGPPVWVWSATRTGERKAAWLARQGLMRQVGQAPLPGLEPDEPRVIRPAVHRQGRVLRPRVNRGE